MWMGVGVIEWKWDVRSLVLLYWWENLIIGALQVVKLLVSPVSISYSWRALILRFGLCGFFVVHYGGFCAVHGLFLLLIGDFSRGPNFGEVNFFLGPFVFLSLLWNVASQTLAILPTSALWSLLAIFVARLVAMIGSYKQWREFEVSVLMLEPYKHIVVVHLAVLFGAMLALWSNNAWPVLLLVVLGKMLLDLREIWGWKRQDSA